MSVSSCGQLSLSRLVGWQFSFLWTRRAGENLRSADRTCKWLSSTSNQQLRSIGRPLHNSPHLQRDLPGGVTGGLVGGWVWFFFFKGSGRRRDSGRSHVWGRILFFLTRDSGELQHPWAFIKTVRVTVCNGHLSVHRRRVESHWAAPQETPDGNSYLTCSDTFWLRGAISSAGERLLTGT